MTLCTFLLSGTHDFHNICVVSPPSSGTVTVTGDMIPGSTSTGMLIIVYSLTQDNVNVHYHFTEHADMQVFSMIMGLPVDRYKVVVFVVEEDGRPFCRAAATPRTVQINGNYAL